MRNFWFGLLTGPQLLHETPGDRGSGGGSGGGGGDRGQSGGGQQGGRGDRGDGGDGRSDGQRGTGRSDSRDFADGQGNRGQRGAQGDRGQQRQQQDDSQRRGYRLAPDALVETEDGRVITYKEYQAEERASMNTDFQGRYRKGYDALVAEATRLDQLRQQYEGRGGQRQNQADDPFASIDDNALMDGRTIKQLVKTLSETGLGPIANVVKALQGQVAGLQKELKGAGSHVAQFQEDRSSAAFQSGLTKVLSEIEVKGFPGGRVDPNEPVIREIAEDLRLSYQEDSWRAGEFEKFLGDRLNAFAAYLLKAQRTFADGAPERLRKAFDPRRGAGRPQGDKKYQYESPQQIVARARDGGMWGGGNART